MNKLFIEALFVGLAKLLFAKSLFSITKYLQLSITNLFTFHKMGEALFFIQKSYVSLCCKKHHCFPYISTINLIKTKL